MNITTKEAIEKKLKWAKTLKPGDLIEDCTNSIVRINTIENEVFPKWTVYRSIPDNFLWIPKETRYKIENFLDAYWPFREIVDRIITKENGSECSVLFCCDRIEKK